MQSASFQAFNARAVRRWPTTALKLHLLMQQLEEFCYHQSWQATRTTINQVSEKLAGLFSGKYRPNSCPLRDVIV